jgi:hypothetical protein
VRLLVASLALAATVTACGTPEQLSRAEGRELEIARDRIVAAIDLNRELGRSPAAADRVLARVRRIVATGSSRASSTSSASRRSVGCGSPPRAS